MAHLDEHKLLSDRQHAFQKRHSCAIQLITDINDWTKILKSWIRADKLTPLTWTSGKRLTPLPPSPPPREVLEMQDIGGKALKWIDSFLCFRQQRVVENGIKSD